MAEQTIALLATIGALGAAIIAFGLLVVCVRHRSAPAAVAVGLLQLALLLITLGTTLLLLSDGGADAYVWYYARFVGYVLAPIGALAIVFEVTGRRSWVRREVLAPLFVVPGITIAIILVSPATFTTPVFESFAGVTIWRPVPGPWFAVYLTYTEALMLVVIVLLVVHAARTTGRPRARSSLLAVGAAFPVAVDIASRVFTWPLLAVTVAITLSFLATGLVFSWVMLRHRLVALSPLAIDLFDTVGDPIFALDDTGRVSLVNQAFAQLCGARPHGLVGEHLGRLPQAPDIGRLLSESVTGRLPSGDEEHTITDVSGTTRTYLVSRSTLTEADGTTLRVGVMRDITDRKAIEEQRDRLVDELREALANVKTLRGFIPVCAACHKVRDDQGYWQAVEQFVRDHTDAQFSHGLCPDCSPKYFPEIDA